MYGTPSLEIKHKMPIGREKLLCKVPHQLGRGLGDSKLSYRISKEFWLEMIRLHNGQTGPPFY